MIKYGGINDSNENGLTVLVSIQDNENGIDTIRYMDKNGQEMLVNAYGKKEIAIDYEIENDGEYIFTVYNSIGEKIEKTLVIDSINKENDTLGDLINIQISPIIDEGRTVAIKANVVIDYKYGLGDNYYKIGNSQTWNNYNEEFQIDSYTILEKNLQETDNKTITIYAKNEDIAQNKITITKQTTELDLDMPNEPIISILYSDNYPRLTEHGMKLYNEVEIQYDNRDDITNYYSLDSGYNWTEYTGKIVGDTDFHICTKSVKNNSGLEQVTMKDVQPSASDALQSQAYDGDEDTYVNCKGKTSKVYLEETVRGKKIYLNLYMQGNNNAYTSRVIYYNTDSTSTTLLSRNSGGGLNINGDYNIPENAEYIAFTGTNNIMVYEINNANSPIITEEKVYPKLTDHGVEPGYCMTSISYYSTSVQRLYKIDDGEWKNYEDKEIKLQTGEILYAKSIDKYGKNSIISSFTSTLPSDALEAQAYDGDTDTYVDLNKRTLKVYLDESVRGKKIYLKLYMQGNNGSYTTRVIFYKTDSTSSTLLSRSSGGGLNINGNYNIPEDAEYIVFTGTNTFRIYEINNADE